jgi:hypothetical protein
MRAVLRSLIVVLQAVVCLQGQSRVLRLRHVGSTQSGMVTFDDFSTQLLNPLDSSPLFTIYTGEDLDQSVLSYPPGDLIVKGASIGNGTVRNGFAPGIYMDIIGPGDTGIYEFPQTYLQTYSRTHGLDWTQVNRMSFLFKGDVAVSARVDGGNILQMGNYLRPHFVDNGSGGDDHGQSGEHYYFQFDFNFYAGVWQGIVLNRHPQHRVGGQPDINWGDDPQWNNLTGNNDGQGLGTTSGFGPVHFFDGLTRLYFDTAGEDTPNANAFASATFHFKDYKVGTISGEPDDEIASIEFCYTGTQYEVSWAGMKMLARTYDVRYSTSDMHVNGFTSGTSGGTVTNQADAFTGVIWQSGAMAENASGLYVAMRVSGASTFSQIHIPFHMGQ